MGNIYKVNKNDANIGRLINCLNINVFLMLYKEVAWIKALLRNHYI